MITSAALIVISVFAAFILMSSVTTKVFGVGLSVAVLLDVTLVRRVLVPAAMSLLGHRAWWQVPAEHACSRPDSARFLRTPDAIGALGPLPSGGTYAPGMARAGGRRRRRLRALLMVVAIAGVGGCGGSTDAGGVAGGGSRTASSASSGSGPAAASEAGSAGAWLRTFRGRTVDGKPFDGASLAGRPTVLWFWAPWCPTCLGQAPGVRAAVERGSGEVNVVGVAGLDQAGAMPDFVRLAKVGSMTHVSDEAGEVWRRFGVTEQSVFVFLDAEGAETFRGKLSAADIPARVAALAS